MAHFSAPRLLHCPELAEGSAAAHFSLVRCPELAEGSAAAHFSLVRCPELAEGSAAEPNEMSDRATAQSIRYQRSPKPTEPITLKRIHRKMSAQMIYPLQSIPKPTTPTQNTHLNR